MLNPMNLLLTTKCNSCRAAPDPGFKTCTECRQKKTAYSKQRSEKAKLARSLTVVNPDIRSGKHIADPLVPKRKKKSMDEVESRPERKKKRVKHILKSYKFNDNTQHGKTMADDPMLFGIEFQTATELYKHLKSLLRKNARLNYKACHSIVSDPACSLEKRAMLVARDIQKVAHVPFNHKVTSTAPTRSRTSYSLQFRCTCTPASGSSTQWPVTKGANVSGEAATELGNTSCQGIVEVMVMDDLRHPLGIAGQQIRIQICH